MLPQYMQHVGSKQTNKQKREGNAATFLLNLSFVALTETQNLTISCKLLPIRWQPAELNPNLDNFVNNTAIQKA